MRLSPIPLRHACVELHPLADPHVAPLTAEAAADPALFRWWSRPMDDVSREFAFLRAEQAAGRWLPYCVLAPRGERVLGVTCFLNIRAAHATVELGSTWYVRSAHGGVTNPAAKLLMLGHAFACGAQRVEFKVDAANARSIGAVLRLGATPEGVHRSNQMRPDGSRRDTAWFSILPAEWPAVRAGLEARLS